jgi:alkylation response protein AidB-like acyl-CoA dehydrogenase
MSSAASKTPFIQKGGGFLIDSLQAADIFVCEELSFEHRGLAEAASKFSTREVFSKAERIEAKEEGLMSKLIRQAGEQGLLMAEVPEEFGGAGLGAVPAAVIAENITHQGSFSVAFMCHTGIGMMPLVYFGNEEQKKRYLPKLASGEMIGAYALTEADAGSDAMAVKTKAVLSGDKRHYILDGEKLFCTNGGIAGLVTVFAKTEGGRLTAFLVEKNFEGISYGKEEEKMGIHGSSTVPIILTQAKIPVENVLGTVGEGHKIAFAVLDIGRFKLGAACIGTMKRLIELMTAYSNERHQFGRPISSFELIRKKIAGAVIDTYLAESSVYRFAGAFDNAMDKAKSDPDPANAKIGVLKEYAVESSIIKVFCSEVLDQMADEAVQIYGGYGYIRDYPVEHHYRDSRINRIYEGTNEINRMVIAGTLLKRALAGTLPLMERLQEILVQLKTGFPAVSETQLMGRCADQIEKLKRLAIYLAGVAAQKFTTQIEKHQSVLALVADLAIDAYVLESGLIRAVKVKGIKAAPTLHEIVITAAIAERLPRLFDRTRQALINIAEGDEKTASPYLKAFDRLVSYMYVDTDALYEKIADHALEREGYEL